MLDMTLLNRCKRHAPNNEEMHALFQAERSVNADEALTLEAVAAAYVCLFILSIIFLTYSVLRSFKEAMKEPCKGILDNGKRCHGEAVYRQYKKVNHFGKSGFIGCSEWVRGKSYEHRFMGIPKDVKEDLLIELFESEDGSFKQHVDTKECARVLHPRNGGKGRQECRKFIRFTLYYTGLTRFKLAYTHLKEGKVVQGTLVHRKCPAKIKIFSPLERSDRRAVVILYNHHNHPKFPSTKLSRDGRDKYEAAVKANGVARSTVLKTDNGV